MAILIKNAEADELIRTLAQRTGESITDAVKEAVRERLRQVPLNESEIGSAKAQARRALCLFRLVTSDQ